MLYRGHKFFRVPIYYSPESEFMNIRRCRDIAMYLVKLDFDGLRTSPRCMGGLRISEPPRCADFQNLSIRYNFILSYNIYFLRFFFGHWKFRSSTSIIN